MRATFASCSACYPQGRAQSTGVTFHFKAHPPELHDDVRASDFRFFIKIHSCSS